MTTKQRELKADYLSGDTVSTAAMIKAGFFVETEAAKMLTAQWHDPRQTDAERWPTRERIERAGYQLARTGNMRAFRVFAVTL